MNEKITSIKIIGTHWIKNGRVKKDLKTLKADKCTPCRSKAGNICCKQVKTTATFKSQQTRKTWEIYDNTNCKKEYVIYLMECTVCNLQCVGKNEALFDIRLNNHRKYIKYLRVILADKNFQKMAIDLTNMQDSR